MAEMALSSSGPSAVTVTVSPPLTPRPISFISWVLLTVLSPLVTEISDVYKRQC